MGSGFSDLGHGASQGTHASRRQEEERLFKKLLMS
jgi:hypothetical protein